jgi:hypothetical protein
MLSRGNQGGISEIAFNVMVKSAIYENLDPADWPYGEFKKKNVRPAHHLFPPKNGDLSYLFASVLHFAAISIHIQKETRLRVMYLLVRTSSNAVAILHFRSSRTQTRLNSRWLANAP